MDAATVVAMLADRVSKGEPQRRIDHSRELEFVEHLYETIINFCSCSSYETESDFTIDVDDAANDSDEDDSLDDTMKDNNEDPSFKPYSTIADNDSILNRFSLDYMLNVLQYYDEMDNQGKRRHSFKSLQHWFRKVSDRSYITRFRAYVGRQGTLREKYSAIDKYVFDLFITARSKFLAVHDDDLRRWARQKALELSLHDFAASNHRIEDFKHYHKLVSRKVTKFVSKHSVTNQEDIRQSKEDFVAQVRDHMKRFSLSSRQIMNSDQIGLNKEIPSTRTLSFMGEKSTIVAVKSKNAISHSYTLQPIINMSGQVMRPILLCLQEASGRISERVQASMFEADNVVVTWSSSGKLTSALVRHWCDRVLMPQVTTKFLLISDAWPGQSDEEIHQKIPGCTRLQIPKGTTGIAQPLMYFGIVK